MGRTVLFHVSRVDGCHFLYGTELVQAKNINIMTTVVKHTEANGPWWRDEGKRKLPGKTEEMKQHSYATTIRIWLQRVDELSFPGAVINGMSVSVENQNQ